MTEPQIEGLTWASLVYDPEDEELSKLAGPDKNTRCESPRHTFGDPKPAAVWVEMLWYPERHLVARCWKTCEPCHIAMARSAEKVPA